MSMLRGREVLDGRNHEDWIRYQYYAALLGIRKAMERLFDGDTART